MKPERMEHWRGAIGSRVSSGCTTVRIPVGELADLLATAEREAKLRELRSRVERLVGQCDPDSEHGLVIGLRAALETKGGEW